MPQSARGSNWILVLANHFTRWADALIIPDVPTPTVTWALDEREFCYFRLLGQIHMDQF